ncbi:MAG: hypothetical protein V1487_01180 [bacterium]
MVKIETVKIVGSASATTWSQAQTVGYGDNRQLLVVLELGQETESTLLDLATIGAEMLAEVERRKESLGDQASIEQVVEEMGKEADLGLKMGLLIAEAKEDKLIVRGVGEVSAYLARGEQLANLGITANGILKEGDVFILTTNRLINEMGIKTIKEVLLTADNPGEILAPLVHTKEETSGVAAIVGTVKSSNKLDTWPQIKLRGENPRKVNLWIGVGLLLLLTIMIGVGMVRRVGVTEERNYLDLESSVKRNTEEVKLTGDVNPILARQLLTESEREIEAYLALTIKEKYRIKAIKLGQSIAIIDEQVFKKNNSQLTMVVELNILTDGLISTKMQSDGRENLIFADESQPRVIGMNLVDRSKTVIELDNKDKLVGVGVAENRIYGLLNSGVIEIDGKKNEAKQVIEADEFWKDPTIIELFAGNVYVFDKEQSEIWKYPTLGETFGGRRRWLAAGITPDLSKVVDMKVVGDVWLLTSTGKLVRYSRGAPVTFEMEGFPYQGEGKVMVDPVAMFVTDNAVYVLESGAQRVVVVGTDGKYLGQYINDEFKNATDLVIVDDKGYVLIDNAVKEFGL